VRAPPARALPLAHPTAAEEDGTCTIAYDDGDKEANVVRRRVRFEHQKQRQ